MIPEGVSKIPPQDSLGVSQFLPSKSEGHEQVYDFSLTVTPDITLASMSVQVPPLRQGVLKSQLIKTEGRSEVEGNSQKTPSQPG